jgi:hypothetical protein
MIVCTLENGQQSSAAPAYALWLSQSLALPLRMDDTETHDELIASPRELDARLLVVGARGTESAQLEPVLSLVEAAPKLLLLCYPRSRLPHGGIFVARGEPRGRPRSAAPTGRPSPPRLRRSPANWLPGSVAEW